MLESVKIFVHPLPLGAPIVDKFTKGTLPVQKTIVSFKSPQQPVLKCMGRQETKRINKKTNLGSTSWKKSFLTEIGRTDAKFKP